MLMVHTFDRIRIIKVIIELELLLEYLLNYSYNSMRLSEDNMLDSNIGRYMPQDYCALFLSE